MTAEFAQIWQALPKLVFSRTLNAVEGNARLAEDEPAEEIARLKAQPGRDIGVGGAGLAADLIERGLVDEYRLFVSPVVVGGGTPYFPAAGLADRARAASRPGRSPHRSCTLRYRRGS